MEDFRRAQQRLGRDATPVQANAAQVIALDDRSLEAKLRRADGGDVTAGTGADDQYVEGSVSHVFIVSREGLGDVLRDTVAE